jgi:chromosomal replication initiation ATPase DnaA
VNSAAVQQAAEAYEAARAHCATPYEAMTIAAYAYRKEVFDRPILARNVAGSAGKPAEAAAVISGVAQYHNLRVKDILGAGRFAELVAARRDIARTLRERGWSYPKIGRAIGGRDHATAMNLCGALRSHEAREAAKVRQATAGSAA